MICLGTRARESENPVNWLASLPEAVLEAREPAGQPSTPGPTLVYEVFVRPEGVARAGSPKRKPGDGGAVGPKLAAPHRGLYILCSRTERERESHSRRFRWWHCGFRAINPVIVSGSPNDNPLL